ncbi:MAG TPA: hypothetical protein VN324_06140 [Quisquiliibacterium sp.]|nr:hypothetical protein [Quisquiliibacterium sp.]
MATNFAYRKRQLELEKKRKKEEKLKRKQERGGEPAPDEAGEQSLEDGSVAQAGEPSEGDSAADAAQPDPDAGQPRQPAQ